MLILATVDIEKQLLKYMNDNCPNQLNIQSLITADAPAVDVAINYATTLDPIKGYPILIIDEHLSRGLDIRSHPKIEENGGVLVLIAKIPGSTKIKEQAIGRTQRFLYKG